MTKDEILARSRKELKNSDLAEKEATLQAWNAAGKIGAVICCLITAFNGFFYNNGSFSLWTVYFSMISVKTLYTYKVLRRRSDLILGILYAALCVVFLTAHVLKLMRGTA